MATLTCVIWCKEPHQSLQMGTSWIRVIILPTHCLTKSIDKHTILPKPNLPNKPLRNIAQQWFGKKMEVHLPVDHRDFPYRLQANLSISMGELDKNINQVRWLLYFLQTKSQALYLYWFEALNISHLDSCLNFCSIYPVVNAGVHLWLPKRCKKNVLQVIRQQPRYYKNCFVHGLWIECLLAPTEFCIILNVKVQ